MTTDENGGSTCASPRARILARVIGEIVPSASVPYRIDQKLKLLEALFVATEGIDEGLKVAVDWSSRWPDAPGRDMIEKLWHRWRQEPPNPGLDLLEGYLRNLGWNWEEYLTDDDLEAIHADEPLPASVEPEPVRPPPSLLLKFSLIDELPKLQSDVLTQEPLCSGLALRGQANVWYAEPNTGKTAMALWFIRRDIQAGSIDPSRLFYFNLDDTLHGLIEKTELAKASGFHVISDGYKGFRVADFPALIEQLIAAHQCQGVVIILDVLKKFTNIMDKQQSSLFGKLIRRFVLRGGTCIALAHTNKRRNADGEPIYAGTSDIIEDFDCAYLVYETDLDPDTQTKTILFANKKSRGNVRKKASFQYGIRDDLSYTDLLESISEVSEADLLTAQRNRQLVTDLALIEIARDAIRSGINQKMALAAALVERSQCSKRTALRIIEEYEGSDPETHFWHFHVGPRGAKIYQLLSP